MFLALSSKAFGLFRVRLSFNYKFIWIVTTVVTSSVYRKKTGDNLTHLTLLFRPLFVVPEKS
jgi:hypothetical protein